MPKLIEQCTERLKKKQKQIVFTDALDERILAAARHLVDHRLAIPLLLGTPSEIREFAQKHGIRTQGLRIQHPLHDTNFDKYVKVLYQQRQRHGLTRFDANELLRDPITFGAMLVQQKQADVCISGNCSDTANVLKAAIQIIGLKPVSKTVSSFYLMVSPDEKSVLAFGDCNVVPRPDSQQLAEIAISTAQNYNTLTGEEPRVAMLSFSTNHSAEHELVDIVRESVLIAKKMKSALILDGEVQFDAAIVPEVAQKKAPNCRLEGRANVFIFPSLNAANIGYNIAESLVGYRAIGPFTQGLNGNMHVLSRLTSTENIIDVALIASCM